LGTTVHGVKYGRMRLRVANAEKTALEDEPAGYFSTIRFWGGRQQNLEEGSPAGTPSPPEGLENGRWDSQKTLLFRGV